MEKDFFSNSCEQTNFLNSLLTSLAAPEHNHAFMPESQEIFQDLWEESEAQLLHSEHTQHFHPNEDLLEKAWDPQTDHLEEAWSDQNLDSAWSQASTNPLQEQDSIKSSAKSILTVLSMQGDSKYTNSEFFKFVERLHSGKTKIQGNEVLEDFEDVWSGDQKEDTVKETLWNGLNSEEKERFEEVWQKANEENEVNEAEMLAQWGKAWEREVEVNKYEGMEGLQGVAEEMLKNAEFNEAILMMEAELKQNPGNAEGWMVLGKVYSEMDRDDQALRCFRSGLESDPYNTELLFSAGVSSISQFDDDLLRSHFSRWLAYNVHYTGIHVPENAHLEGVLQGFLAALELNPHDFQLNTGLGLMYFAINNHEAAEYYLQTANMLREGQYDVMNKLGVVLMQQKKYSEAFEYFQRSLDMNKDYVKAWANFGKCASAVGDSKKAVECFLTAATIYPSEHLFELTRSVFNLMDRPDLADRLNNRSPLEFVDEFNIINLKNH